MQSNETLSNLSCSEASWFLLFCVRNNSVSDWYQPVWWYTRWISKPDHNIWCLLYKGPCTMECRMWKVVLEVLLTRKGSFSCELCDSVRRRQGALCSLNFTAKWCASGHSPHSLLGHRSLSHTFLWALYQEWTQWRTKIVFFSIFANYI